MSICWWCYWGWPKAIYEIMDRAIEDIDNLLPVPNFDNDWTEWEGEPRDGESALKWGPAHCVWEDENFDGDFAFEFNLIDNDPRFKDWYPGTLAILRHSLEELAELPKELRSSPEGYDGEHPENYPPPAGIPWEGRD